MGIPPQGMDIDSDKDRNDTVPDEIFVDPNSPDLLMARRNNAPSFGVPLQSANQLFDPH
jgi:hypothetical protein